jgi:hypothetical protein
MKNFLSPAELDRIKRLMELGRSTEQILEEFPLEKRDLAAEGLTAFSGGDVDRESFLSAQTGH